MSDKEKPVISERLTKKLFKPLPDEALSKHPTKSYLSVISPIYVVERLNEVFGVGEWRFETSPIDKEAATGKSKKGSMCVVKGTLTVPKYGILLEQYGGNDNTDLGDAYKGAATDALTKIASYLGIGFDVYKGKHDHKKKKKRSLNLDED